MQWARNLILEKLQAYLKESIGKLTGQSQQFLHFYTALST